MGDGDEFCSVARHNTPGRGLEDRGLYWTLDFSNAAGWMVWRRQILPDGVEHPFDGRGAGGIRDNGRRALRNVNEFSSTPERTRSTTVGRAYSNTPSYGQSRRQPPSACISSHFSGIRARKQQLQRQLQLPPKIKSQEFSGDEQGQPDYVRRDANLAQTRSEDVSSR